MKTRIVTWLIAGLCAFYSAPGHASESTAPHGSVQGRVQNVVTGQYLNNARVSIKGTNLVDQTDETGTFRFAQVPTGSAVLSVFYTGLDAAEVTVQVAAGSTAVRDVGLTNAARYGQTAGAVKLDAFVVSTARDTNAESIAINEQRFAANLKNVVSTDAFGDVTDGNVGEFMKFLPGVTTDSDVNEGGTVTSVSIRGFAANMTQVSTDGALLANTGSAVGNGRTFYFAQVSTNNLSRVEVTKSPTPANPADTMAGSVNLISKSAFERKNAQLNWTINFAGSSQSLSLSKEPWINDRMIHKVLPGVSFDYTLPLNRNFGVVVTGLNLERYVDQTQNTSTFATTAAAGASNSNPFLQAVRYVEGPRISIRRSLGTKGDWRITPNSVLTAGFTASSFTNNRSAVDLTVNTGTNPAPSVANGRRLTFGENFTSGATGRGVIGMLSTFDTDKPGRTQAGNLRYRFDNGLWKVDAGLDRSASVGSLRDTTASPGRFRGMGISFAAPVRVEFSNMGEFGPRTIRLFDNSERAVDLSDIRNYRINTGLSANRDFSEDVESAKVDVRRRFALFPFPVAVQIGGAERTQSRDVHRYNETWNYTGPDDVTFLTHTKYHTRDDSRFARIPWISVVKAWSAFQADPRLFTQTPAQVVAGRTATITGSEFVRERVSAGYAQVEANLFQRLNVLTGVRFERTALDGLGPFFDPTAVWVRNPDGSFARTPTGARSRKAEAGAVGSLQELALVRKERGFRADRTYDGYYPSVHLTYNLRPNLLARASYASTYGRPDFTEIIPNTAITELDANNDPNVLDGRIRLRNPALKPWSAKNYDLSLEYYTPQGGLFSAGAFRKDITDFFVDSTRLATPEDLSDFGLAPQYLGWEINTTANGGKARVDGFEFNVQHSLQLLGAWAAPYGIFLNGSKLTLSGDQKGSFGGFVPESFSWGVKANYQRLRLIARWNYRGPQLRSVFEALGPNGAQYTVRRTTMDLNTDFRINSRLTLFANLQNVFGIVDQVERYGDDTPAYARRIQETDQGTLITVGLKGSF